MAHFPGPEIGLGGIEALAFLVIAAVGFLIQIHFTQTVRKINLLPGPPALPVIGHSHKIRNSEERFDTFMSWIKQYGSRYCLFFGYRVPVVLLTAPSDVQKILGSMEKQRKSSLYKAMIPWFGKGILMSTGTTWQKLRKLTVPAFHGKIIEGFMPIFNKYGRRFAQVLEAEATKASSVIDVYPHSADGALRTVFETSFGVALDTLENSEAVVEATMGLGDAIVTRMTRPWLEPTFLWNLSSYGRKERKYLKVMNDVIVKVIKSRKLALKNGEMAQIVAMSENENSGGNIGFTKLRIPFLDLMVVKQAEGHTVLQDDIIRDTTSTVTAAGHDTTANTISWAIYFLGIHPELQQLVHQELDEIFADDPNRDISNEDLSRMKYLESCIKETLRLIPPLPIIIRYIDEDIKLDDGTVLPKGADALVFIYGLHRNPEIYPDPDRFDPSRFFPENSVGRHPFSYVPFSAGPKSCVGYRYALQEAKVFLAHVFRNLVVTSMDKIQDIAILPDIVLRPKDGIKIMLKHRQKN